MNDVNHTYRTHNEVKNGKIVKVAGSIKRHDAESNQGELNRINYGTAAKDVIIVPIWQKITLTIEEAASYSNIGITKLYEITNNPRCNFILHVGTRKRLIKRKEFEKYLSQIIEI